MAACPLGSLTPCNLVIPKKSNHVDTASQIFETIPADPGRARETLPWTPAIPEWIPKIRRAPRGPPWFSAIRTPQGNKSMVPDRVWSVHNWAIL
jgi:hypothetical protein